MTRWVKSDIIIVYNYMHSHTGETAPGRKQMSRFILRADASPAAYERLLDGNVIETKAIEAVIANTSCAIEKLEQEISILERSAACTEEDYKKQLSLYEDIQGERLHIQSAIDRLLEEKHSRLMYMEIESRDKKATMNAGAKMGYFYSNTYRCL